MEPELDPAFPKGCLSNCPTRSQINEKEKQEKESRIEGGSGSVGDDKRKSSICNA
jgi:hypothetical protein